MKKHTPSIPSPSYPDWAPKKLVEIHIARSTKPTNTPSIEKKIDQWAEEKHLSVDAKASLREAMYRTQFFLPEKEGTELLGRLLTDLRMKDVWVPIGRRAQDEKDAIHLWQTCDSSLAAWRGEPKLTAKERERLFLEIRDLALKLESSMSSTREFTHYFIADQIDDKTIGWLLKEVNADSPSKTEQENIDYTRFCFSEVIPSFHVLLLDLAKKAEGYSQSVKPQVTKPGSQNANIHYFVRSLSGYFKNRYDQPLHDVVATLANVVFNRDDLDSDLVRKLVRT